MSDYINLNKQRSKLATTYLIDEEEEDIVSTILNSHHIAKLMKEDEEKRVLVMRNYKKSNYWRYRREYRNLKAQELVDEGIVNTIKAAKQLYTSMRSHRASLHWCRTNSQRYLDQLSPHEFRGLFRMDRVLFNSIEEKLKTYFELKNVYVRDAKIRGGKSATPTRFLLAGTLRWLAGGSSHDIVYFCGVRYPTFQRYRWDVLAALIELYYDNEVRLPSTSEEREIYIPQCKR